jgi:hypothetical protein
VIGWVRNEAFYGGRPTSFWASEIRESYIPLFAGSGFIVGEVAQPSVPSGQVGWLYCKQLNTLDRFLSWLQVDIVGRRSPQEGTPLLEGDKAALPVLLELLYADDPKVREVAAWGLALLDGTQPILKSVKREIGS